MEEARDQVIPQLVAFLDKSDVQEAISSQRLTSSEITALTPTGAGTGTSGVSGIQTRILKGNPEHVTAFVLLTAVGLDFTVTSTVNVLPSQPLRLVGVTV